MCINDDFGVLCLRRAAAITHKVMKHGAIRLVEDAFDESRPVTHDQLATKAEDFCENPSQVKLNVPPGPLESCYFPIIQVRLVHVSFLALMN